MLFAGNFGYQKSNKVKVVDTSTSTLVKEFQPNFGLPSGYSIRHMAVSNDAKFLYFFGSFYVGSSGHPMSFIAKCSVLDPTQVCTIKLVADVGQYPYVAGMTIATDNRVLLLYVVSTSTGNSYQIYSAGII